MYKGKGSAADGTLAPAEVADRFNFVSPRTAFVVWGSWGFDVDYVSTWLNQERVDHNLPKKDEVHLLLAEFKANLRKYLGG